MELPADPKEVFGKVADELKTKFDECGMAAVDTFVDELEKVKDMVEKGPAELISQMKKQFDDFKDKIDSMMENPETLAPSGSALASCAGWYGKAVVKKLKAFNEDVNELIETVKALVAELADPIKQLGETLKNAMDSMDGTVKKLAKLPAQISTLASEITGPEDVAKVEVDPMKKCLDVSGISSPLEALTGLKGPLKAAVEAVKKGVQRIADFIKDAPDKIKKAFAIPVPCCCCTSCWLSQAPAAVGQLMAMLDGMKALDLNPVIGGFDSVSTTICDLDPAKVSDPVNKFAEQAAGPVDNLDKVVAAAKLATGGPGGFIDQVKSLF